MQFSMFFPRPIGLFLRTTPPAALPRSRIRFRFCISSERNGQWPWWAQVDSNHSAVRNSRPAHKCVMLRLVFILAIAHLCAGLLCSLVCRLASSPTGLVRFGVKLSRLSGAFLMAFSLSPIPYGIGGLKWTRTTDLALIRRAL